VTSSTSISELRAVWFPAEGESISRQPSIEISMTIDVDEKTPSPTFGKFLPKRADGDIGQKEFVAL
jgi:hypothetical protein